VPDVVERYLGAMTRHDWDAFAACLTEDVCRTGPYGDAYRSRPDYVAFLSQLMPTLPGYSMQVDRVTYVDGDRRAFAELSETVEVQGAPKVTPEVLVFDLTADGLIATITIYIQTRAS
jgi:hypothetical protein